MLGVGAESWRHVAVLVASRYSVLVFCPPPVGTKMSDLCDVVVLTFRMVVRDELQRRIDRRGNVLILPKQIAFHTIWCI